MAIHGESIGSIVTTGTLTEPSAELSFHPAGHEAPSGSGPVLEIRIQLTGQELHLMLKEQQVREMRELLDESIRQLWDRH